MDLLSQSSMKYSQAISVFNYIAFLFVLFAFVFLAASFYVAFRPGLRELPGPFLARFSGLYRLSLVYGGQAPYQYRRLHQKFGPIVRVGPNHVSVSDPAAVPQIYGVGTNYRKVIEVLKTETLWLTKS